jgi:molybdenum cofactor synthesis domain-containing protein
MFTVEILCIGNELLSGITVNTNAHWISYQLTQAGGIVKRITVVGDDVSEISSAVKESIARRPEWLIVSGGLGPTHDDKTLLGVAIGIGVDLVLDKNAAEMLKKSYARRSKIYELNDIRLKMAKIPRDSTPIQNPVGTAPSVIICGTHDRANIVCLPGVPKEMEAIFLESILPEIKKTVGEFYVVESSFEVIGVSEAMLAPVLSKIIESNTLDRNYIKTHPLEYSSDNKPRLRVQIIAKGNDKHEVETRHNTVSCIIVQEIRMLKGKIISKR